MKILATTLICTFLLSCNNKEGKKAIDIESKNDPKIAQQEEEKSTDTDKILKQNGDYSQLFNKNPKNCDFITAADLAASINVPTESVTVGNVACAYDVKEENGNQTRFYFSIEPWGNKMILEEIRSAKENAETFGKDSRLSQYRISETADTYLSMHQNRMIRILNEKNDTAIVLFYQAKIDPKEKDVEKINRLKDESRDRAYKISNFLLNKYQK